MKHTKRLMVASMLVLIMIVSNNLKSAASPDFIGATAESPYPPPITEFTVATGSANQMNPAISGNAVVWSEQPGGVGRQDASDIYGLDLSGGPQFVIRRAAGALTSPRTSGKLVVWEDQRSDIGGDIYAYDLEQKREFAVATGPAFQSSPAVSGNIIVWQERQSGNTVDSNIHAYDTSTGREFRIATAPFSQSNVRISGNIVVWQIEIREADGRLNSDIYGYDMATNRRFDVATGPSFQVTPDISGKRVVWSESQTDNPERSIRMLDIDTSATTVIARGTWELLGPAIDGDLVAWSDNREGRGYDIYGYDLKKQAEFPVSRAIGDQTGPAISGKRVVWADSRSQGVGKYDWNLDIYGATLEDKPGPIVPITGALSEVDAKIEIVWPHGGAPVTEADRANISAYLFHPGTLDLAPCQWRPTVRLWAAVDSEPTSPVAVAVPGVRYTSQGALRTWEFNDVDVSAARDPAHRIYFFITVDGVNSHTNVWAHAADARTYFPQQDIPVGIATTTDKLDAKIQIVWPHDSQGNPRSVTEASLVNVGVDLLARGSMLSVPPDWNGTVRLYRSFNNGIEQMVAVGQKRLISQGGLTYPRWDFNDIDVNAATDPVNKYYFRVAVDGVDTRSSVWSHGADGRTYFPNIDLPTSGCR